MKIKVESSKASAIFDELLRGVRDGKRYTITLRDEVVADLVPAGYAQKTEVAAGVANMQKLFATCVPIMGVDTKALIEEGRD